MSDTMQHTLLVVDDEADFCLLFERHFRRLGYEVLSAADGIAALEVFEQRPWNIDLVISDIRMPRMDGSALIQELRRRRRHLPIIGITGEDDLKETLAFLDNGAYYYVEKPVEHWTIVERLVANAIHLHHREEELEKKRQKEREIARLLRAHLLRSPIGDNRLGCHPERVCELEVACEPIEIAYPSGDYAEWFERRTGDVVFYIADASGHNDLVASFTACLSSMVLHRSHHRASGLGEPPSAIEIIEAIDGAIDDLRTADALGDHRYLTFFVGVIDLLTARLTYVNAGHQDGLWIRRGEDGKAHCERLASTCQAVGHLARWKFPVKAESRDLAPGDLLFLFTDGASELLGDGSANEGIDSLLDILCRQPYASARQAVEGVVEALRQYVGDGDFEDDTTLLAVRLEERS